MANTQSTISIVVVVAVALFALSSGVRGQSPKSAPSPVSGAEMAPAPSPSMDCITPLLNLTYCLTYVEAGSNLTTPDTGCCPALAGIITASPACLCQVLANSSINIAGVDIDRSKALSLPSVCKSGVSTDLCSLLGYPVAPAPGPGMTANPDESSAPASPGSHPSSQGTLNSRISALALFIGLSGVAAAIF